MARDNGILFNEQIVLNTADSIEKCNTNLYNILGEISKKAQETSQYYNSEAAESTRAAMERKKPSFEDYRSVIAQYVTFLRKTAEQYRVVESTSKSEADNI